MRNRAPTASGGRQPRRTSTRQSGLITCSRCREEVHYDASNYIDGLTFYCERCRWDEVLYSGYDLGRTW